MRQFFLLLFCVFSAACGGSSNDIPIQEYHQAIQPLMYENRQLADYFTDLAGRIHLDKVTGDEVAGEFKDKLIPLAKRLESSAQRIQLREGPLARVHAGLVVAWKLRTNSYSEMLRAYQTSDTEVFTEALQANTQSKQKEQDYFELANRYFSTKSLHLYQFPETQ